MERSKFGNRKKGVNCNKPLKKERERQLREKPSYTSIKGDGPSSRNTDRPPPGLKGRELGMWYKNRNRNRERDQQEKIKSMSVVLDRWKQEEIENLLFAVGAPESNSGESSIKEGAFKKKFLNKINVTFEDKLNEMKDIRTKQCEEVDEELFSELLGKKKNNKEYNEMLEFRKTLPSYSKRKEILNLIESNQVTVISGETGCGKTTQIVQFVLDDYILNHKGSLYCAICTQPRRISAVSVAERVAAERAEKLGESVGYVIRLESEPPKKKTGSITFVTTGILIQMLQSNPALSGITHIFVDEIHERDILCDFLITLLKTLMSKRPDLKIILMSATLNAHHFSQYFGGVPCIEIPGFTYPVEELYLEDILGKIHFRFPPPRKIAPWKAHKNKDPIFTNYVIPYINELDKSQAYPKSVLQELRNPESEVLNIDLISAVVFHICCKEPEGAILVFVPGLAQIQDLRSSLMRNKFFSSGKYLIIPMHSILPTVNQKKAFVKPPKGVRKIVIATSIAETSITINDVKYVVDSGRLKTKGFDLEKNVSTLEPEWETLANARQRRGRAGRTQPGKCYKLYTKAREETFEPYPIPEMQRSRLEEVILKVKFLQLGKVEPFLEKVLDPPDSKAVKLSLKLLTTLNVLDSDENLTPLGFHLAKLPVDVQTGKMILMGALFGCIDPILSIAACLNFKDPFVFIMGKEQQVDETRQKFSHGEKSDHFMLSEALRKWEEAESEGNGYNYAYENYLSNSNLYLLRNLKHEFAKHLRSMNFLVSDDPKHPKSNVNSHNVSLVKAIVCSGLYPNVAVIRRIVHRKSSNVPGRIFWKTADHPSVEFHIKSLLKNVRIFESPFVVYFEKVKSSSIFLYDATMVYPMALLFFGERLDIIEGVDGYCIRVNDMITFQCFKKTGLLVQKLRNQLQWILESAISNPEVVDWEKEDKKTLILKAIVELITSEDKTSMDDLVEYDMD